MRRYSKELEDGESYLLESMDMRCGSSRHTAAVVSLGVPGIFVYVVGVPAGLMVRRCRLTLSNPRRKRQELSA